MLDRRLLSVLLVASLLPGCVVNPGGPSAVGNHLVVENERSDPVTVQITITQNGSVVYEETHTVENRTELEDVVERGPEYEVTATLPDGTTANSSWDPANACGSLSVVVERDETFFSMGPC